MHKASTMWISAFSSLRWPKLKGETVALRLTFVRDEETISNYISAMGL